jgi:hypothetical protein
MTDPFWYKEPSIIFKSERLTEFFPSQDQSLEERLNAIVRLALYSSIILYFYHSDIKYLFIVIATIIFTFYIYQNKPTLIQTEDEKTEEHLEDEKKVEKLENEKCTMPTIDNPFMNVTMKDYLNTDSETGKIIDRPVACDTSDPEIKKQIDKLFDNNLYKDVNDIFGKMNSQRQFFTMPSTSIPNKQDEFAKWLYLNPKTCKEDQDYCAPFEDLRAKRPIFVDPMQNPVETKRLE